MDRKTEKILSKTHISKWRKELAALYGSGPGGNIYKSACDKYLVLLRDMKPRPDKALARHMERGILPTLAIYEAYISNGFSQEDAFESIDHLYRLSTYPQARFYKVLGHLPFFFQIFRKAVKVVMKRYYPPEGWDTVWIENSKKLIAFDIRRCFYLDAFNSYGCKELTRCCCGVDDCLYEKMSPSVSWERTRTIGRGDEICNFRFRAR